MAKRKGMDFEALIGPGENPRGTVSQTPNGTAIQGSSGWNKQWDYERPTVPREGAWRGDRSGE